MSARSVFNLAIVLAAVSFHEVWAQNAFRDCADCPEMVVIPAGEFRMGAALEEHQREQSPERYIAWESPIRTVRIDRPFAAGVAEITRAQFETYVNETGATITGCDIAKGNEWDSRPDKSWRDPGFTQAATHPVVCVNWHDVQAYVSWLRSKTGKPYRLATEAEWEYIARAGTQTARFWGDGREDACLYANVPDKTHAQTTQTKSDTFECSDGYAFTSPVQSFRANRFGVFDTLGNVWEWVDDCFHDSYAGAALTATSRQSDPSCQHHQGRGGSWNPRLATQIRSAARGRVTTTLRNSNLGFRVAMDLPR